MKLPDFRENQGMNNLRALIGANLNYDYAPESSWDPLVVKLLNDGELDGVPLSDITVANDGTLEYRGVKVVVYIRDQFSKGFNFTTGTSTYKFHFYNCGTISQYRTEGKFDGKYVVNRSKKFNVNIIDFGEIIHTNLELDLHVCKQCLQCLHYKGYQNHGGVLESEIYNNFTREEYFESFKSKVHIPLHNHLSKPLDVYPENWNKISLKAKEVAGYVCQDCGLDCSISKVGLQVHHKDHNKGNNSISNHEVLCYECHSKHHAHMK